MNLEKQAASAWKERAMAQRAGIMPEGNWKGALRQLRDERGNLLEGKDLADAKQQMGMMDNNSYQKLKSLERKHGQGIPMSKANSSNPATEIGGVMDDAGKVIKQYMGEQGASSVAHQNSDYLTGKRIFHTHQNKGGIAMVNKSKKGLKLNNDIIARDSEKFMNSGLTLNPGAGTAYYNDHKTNAKKSVFNAIQNRNTSLENIERFSGKRNPLLVAPSGSRAIEMTRATGGNKNKIKAYRDATEQGIIDHNKVLGDVRGYMNQGGRDWSKVDELMSEKGPDMLSALKKERARNEFKNPGSVRSGDIAVTVNRANGHRNGVVDNILAPALDMEGIHKTKVGNVGGSGGWTMKSTYMDRAPKKVREANASAMESKVKDFMAGQKGVNNSSIQDRLNAFKQSKNPTPQATPQVVPKQGLSRNTKIGLGLGAGALALGAGAYGLKKLNDKRQEKKANEQVHYELQIEKYALNAQKARSMAKEVGLVPQGAWKYGLRKSRNMKTGDLLKGRELAEAHAKLGKLPNNAYQKIKASARKLPSGTEIGGLLDGKNNIAAIKKGGVRAGNVGDFIDGKQVAFHTHPGFAGEGRFALGKNPLPENIMRFSKKERNPLIAELSGKITSQSGNVNMNKQQLQQAMNKFDKGVAISDEALHLQKMKSKLPMEAPVQNQYGTVFHAPSIISKKHDKAFNKINELDDRSSSLFNTVYRSAPDYHHNSIEKLTGTDVMKRDYTPDSLVDIKSKAYSNFIKKKQMQLESTRKDSDKVRKVLNETSVFVDNDTPIARAKHNARQENKRFIDSLDANKMKVRDKIQSQQDSLKRLSDEKKRPMKSFMSNNNGDFDADGGLRGFVIDDKDRIIPNYSRKNHNVVAPDQNFEGVHAVGNSSYKGDIMPNQRVRSIFFDRAPRKAR